MKTWMWIAFAAVLLSMLAVMYANKKEDAGSAEGSLGDFKPPPRTAKNPTAAAVPLQAPQGAGLSVVDMVAMLNAGRKPSIIAVGFPSREKVPLLANPEPDSSGRHEYAKGSLIGNATGQKKLHKDGNGRNAWYIEINGFNGKSGWMNIGWVDFQS